jgi:hypothetical protein
MEYKMTYKYLVVDTYSGNFEDLNDVLNHYGEQGWRLIQTNGTIMYFIKEVLVGIDKEKKK